MAGDYIPHQDGAFLEWAVNLLSYTAANKERFGIAEAAITPLQTELAAYQTAHAAAIAPNHGKADTTAKNEARDSLKSALRRFVNAHLRYNEAVSDSDKNKLGLHIPDGKPSPVSAPATRPEFEIDLSQFRQLRVSFHDQDSSRRGKPAGVHGAEIRWDFHDAPPAEVEELSHSEFATKTPHTLGFTEGQRGKRVYICLRWENSKGDKGPWGELLNAIVP